jgi:hypothetical protein
MARDDNTAAEGGKADHDKHRGTVHFDTVLESEHEAINARREGKSRSHIQSESNGTGSRGSCLRHNRACVVGRRDSLRCVLSWGPASP